MFILRDRFIADPGHLLLLRCGAGVLRLKQAIIEICFVRVVLENKRVAHGQYLEDHAVVIGRRCIMDAAKNSLRKGRVILVLRRIETSSKVIGHFHEALHVLF